MSKPLKAFLDANPELGGLAPPRPVPGTGTRVHTVRAQQPGGELMSYVPSEKILWFEQLYRVLPPDGMYQATPNRPLTINMGSVRVPKSMVLVIIDYAFDIYRFLGGGAGDFIPIETSRLSTQVGWDINIDNNRPANLSMNLLPKQQSQTQQAFQAQVGPNQPPQQWQFDLARANQNQVAAGPGMSLLPQRHRRGGSIQLSNTYVAKSSQSLNVACSILNQIPIPIGFFEANIWGALMQQDVYDAYQQAGVPVGDPLVNHMPGAP